MVEVVNTDQMRIIRRLLPVCVAVRVLKVQCQLVKQSFAMLESVSISMCDSNLGSCAHAYISTTERLNLVMQGAHVSHRHESTKLQPERKETVLCREGWPEI